MYQRIIKPISDRLLALVLLLAMAPLIVPLSIVLAISFKKWPFFLQERGGYRGRVFKVVKFKTMTDERDANGELLTDKDRLTKLGGMVRSFSLDELPQVINVLKGDMSFIGPRPFLSEYLSIYSEAEKRRHDVRPGITGWAQVNGRNSISWKEKFEMDLWYVDNISFLTDLKIVYMTVVKTLARDSVNQQNDVTMEKYNGRN